MFAVRPKLQEKAKVMAAARILQDAEAAAVLNSSIIRGSIEAAKTLTNWVRNTEYKAEVPIAGSLAVQRLTRIEARARGMESKRIEHDLISEVHNCTTSLRRAVWQKQPPLAGGTEDSMSSSSSERGTTSDSSSFQSSVSVDEVNLLEDQNRCGAMSVKYTFIFWLCLIVLAVSGTVLLAVLDTRRTNGEIDDFHRNVTLELAQVARIALELVHETLVDRNMVVDRALASSFLADMTSMTSDASTLDMYKDGDEHLREYRGAVQDFSDDRVLAVTTPRSFGGLCQKNQTFVIQPKNDAFAGQAVVMLRPTPNECADDAGSGGVFKLVVPSFLRFGSHAETYRRNEARVASFNNLDFGISVAVTYDRETFQEFCTPSNTLYGTLLEDHTPQRIASTMASLWATLITTTLVVVLLAIIVWMLCTSYRFHFVIFSVLLGFTMTVGLVVVMLVVQKYNAAWLDSVIEIGTQTVLESITLAMLTPTIRQLSLPRTLLSVLNSGFFAGRLAGIDTGTREVEPENMADLLTELDVWTIASYRRGQYSIISHDYAIGTTYIHTDGVLIVMTRKLDPRMEVNIDLLIPLAWGVITGIFTYCYLRFSPTFRLRKYAIQLSFLRQHLSPLTGKVLLYILIFAASLGGAMGGAAYGTWQFDSFTQRYAQEVLVLVAACLRASSVVDVCTYGCGMADFTAMLYFTQAKAPNAMYPTISVIGEDMPLPFPPDDQWEARYLGAQLAMNQLQTTLINVPSFATPLINATWGGMEPRFVRRHMLSTSSINSSTGFIIERFPSSFDPMMYPLKTYSVGITVLLVTACLVCVAVEKLYMEIHRRHRKGRPVGFLLGIMLGTVGLIVVGFIVFGFLCLPLLTSEIRFFAFHELQFLLNAVKYRVGLVVLMKDYTNQDDLVNELVQDAEDISLSSMEYGRRFFRLRVAREDGFRGSGVVKVYDAEWTDPVNIGPLDGGSIPSCGVNNAKVFTNLTGELLYCYQEVPQNFEDVLNTPRIFLVGVFSKDVWVEETLEGIWPGLVGAIFLIGFVVALVLVGITAAIMKSAAGVGYPLIQGRNMETFHKKVLPPDLKIECYISPRDRLWWILSFGALGLVAVLWTILAGHVVDLVRESDEVSLVYQSQADLLSILITDAEMHSHDYLAYPFPEVTIDHLEELAADAEDGTLEYKFVTTEGLEEFKESVLTVSQNVSQSTGYLQTWLRCATFGYGTFTSLISMKYESMLIESQERVWKYFDTLLEGLHALMDQYDQLDFSPAIAVIHDIAIIRDYMHKLFVLDHLIVSSIASVSASADTWPFPSDNVEEILKNTRTAAGELFPVIDSKLVMLKRSLTALNVPLRLTGAVDKISSYYRLAVAVDSVVDPFWEYQNARLDELSVLSNMAKIQLALREKKEQQACILGQSVHLQRAKEVELSARRSRQLREYLDSGEQIERVFTTLAWQRSQTIATAASVGDVMFICALVVYVGSSGSILVAFALLRKRAEVIQEEVFEEEKRRGDPGEETLPPPPVIASDAQGKIVYYPGEGKGKGKWWKQKLGKAKETKELQNGNGGQMIYGDGWKENRGIDELSLVGSPLAMGEEERSSSSSSFFSSEENHPRRRKQSTILKPVLLFLFCSLAPLITSFVMLLLLEKAARVHEKDTAIILSIQPKILSLSQSLDEFLLELDLYYTQAISLDTALEFLAVVQVSVEQVIGGYIWENQSPTSGVIRRLRHVVQEFTETVREEMRLYKNMVAIVAPFYDVQSAYSRRTLLTLTNDNTYASLIPVAMTTESSALYTFAEDAFNTAVTQASAATTVEDFMPIYEEYYVLMNEVCNVAQAELQMWHAVIAGGSRGGGPSALKYSNFASFVGQDALMKLTTSTEPSAAAAVAEITAYFQGLLDATPTNEDVRNLFLNTLTAPTLSSPPTSSDAYFGAAYASSYLSSITTLAGFSNAFGYNRNFVSVSDLLGGNRTMIDIADEAKSLIGELLTSIDQFRGVSIGPANRNEWIWYTEVLAEKEKGLSDHLNLGFLAMAFKWCCIAFFWGIACTAALGAVLLFPGLK